MYVVAFHRAQSLDSLLLDLKIGSGHFPRIPPHARGGLG